MGIRSYISLTRLLKSASNASPQNEEMPKSAKRALERSKRMRPFNINREEHGTRPWHSYKPN